MGSQPCRCVIVYFLVVLSSTFAEPAAPSGQDVCSVGSACSSEEPETGLAATKNELLHWISDQGGVVDGIAIRWASATDRSLVASREISEGAVVLTVPLEMVIHTRRAADSPLGKALLQMAPLPVDNVASWDMEGLLLTTWLLHERRARPSRWDKYLASLPYWFPTTPLNFSQQELDLCTAGLPALQRSLRSLISYFEEEWQVIQEVARRASIGTTREEFLWARLVSFSRTFTVSKMRVNLDLTLAGGPRAKVLPQLGETVKELNSDGGLSAALQQGLQQDEASVLVPLADMINHARGRKVNCAWHYESQKGFMVKTKQSLAMGEELFISYGNKGNDIFLPHYGFAELANPHDALDIVLPFPSADDSQKADGEAAAPVQADQGMPLKIDGSKPASVELIRAVLESCRAQALRGEPSLNETQAEVATLKILERSLASEAEVYTVAPDCPIACAAFRESQQALLGTWRRFIKAALGFMHGSWPPAGAPLPERFELHARLYFGTWLGYLGPLGRDLLDKSNAFGAVTYGDVSYMDIYDFDTLDV